MPETWTHEDLRKIVKEEIQNAFQEEIREECRKYLAILKDTLMVSLIGYMSEERRKLEEKYGSGRVQEAYGELPEGTNDERDPDLEYPEDAELENTRVMS